MFCVSVDSRGVTGEWTLSRGSKGLSGFLRLGGSLGRGGKVDERRPGNIAAEDITIFTKCQ